MSCQGHHPRVAPNPLPYKKQRTGLGSFPTVLEFRKMDPAMISVNFQMAINIWLSAEEAGDEEVVELWAALLDAHSWVVYDQAPAITRAGVLTLLSWNTAQELLDHHPWLSPPLVLACFWLLRRDQLVLVPQL